jgi:uncharacterized membrane protein YtjA (UPF0391 family)
MIAPWNLGRFRRVGAMGPALSAGQRSFVMLKWALICLVISIVAGALGFRGVSSAAGTIAKVLFGIFLLLFIIILIMAITAGQLVF